ncbi:MAG: PorT family protein, partial [Bacteroides sp.]|nr:PorT family protein [Bacteroides sp.]
MKRLLLLLLSIFCLGALKAQEVRLGAFAGVNVSTPSELRSKLGLSVGVKGELQFQNSMYFELGLSLNSKGW